MIYIWEREEKESAYQSKGYRLLLYEDTEDWGSFLANKEHLQQHLCFQSQQGKIQELSDA